MSKVLIGTGDMKARLRQIERITFSRHFYEPKVVTRGIMEGEIVSDLKDPKRLLAVEDQGEDARGHKFALLFSKSNKYDLKLLVSIKDKDVNVITTHIQNIKRRKVLEQWLRKRR